MFDPGDSWLFGQPTFKLFSDAEVRTLPKTFPFLEEDDTTPFATLDLTYERFSGDLTHQEATRVSPGWESGMETGECLGGGCYNALDAATITTMRDTIGNRTLFQGNGWLFGDGLSLVSALGRFLPQTQSRFFETHLYNGRGASTETDGVVTGTTGCTNSIGTCAIVRGYAVSGADCSVVTPTMTSYGDCCGHCESVLEPNCAFWSYDNADSTCTICKSTGTITASDSDTLIVGTPYTYYKQEFTMTSSDGNTECLGYLIPSLKSIVDSLSPFPLLVGCVCTDSSFFFSSMLMLAP